VTTDPSGRGGLDRSDADDHDDHDDLDEIGSDRFPFAIIPLGFLVLVGIVAGLLLADLDDSVTTPPGTTPTVVTTTTR
jgi:hypothetical protein